MDLYPLAKDPELNGRREAVPRALWKEEMPAVPHGYLFPVAYLWKRTVRCKKPGCGGAVPLARQTWLCQKENKNKKGGRYIALRKTWDRREKRVQFAVSQSVSMAGLGFDPSDGSRGGSTVCPGCQSPIDDAYVKAEGCAKRFGHQLMAIVCGSTEGLATRVSADQHIERGRPVDWDRVPVYKGLSSVRIEEHGGRKRGDDDDRTTGA